MMPVSDLETPEERDVAVELPRITADFGYSEEHGLTRDAARRFLAEHAPIAEIRRLASDSLGYDPGVWKSVAELGLIGLVSPPEHGGTGLDHLHLALFLDEMGRTLLPSPYVGCLLALRALESAGGVEQMARYCPPIISGELIATVGLGEPGGSWEPDDVEARAERVDTGFELSGTKTHVPFGAAATLMIAPFRMADSTVALFAVDLSAPNVQIAPENTVDSTCRTAKITLSGVRVSADARIEGDGLGALSATHRLGWFALAAEMIGSLEATFEMTRRYACERLQFGRPIGAFQAVKHPIVDIMVGLELARSLVLGAAAALDQDPGRAELSCRMAKAYAGDVLAFAVRKAVQLHGGFGFTWDCDAHFYFKRALHYRGTLGDGVHHRRHVAERLLGSG